MPAPNISAPPTPINILAKLSPSVVDFPSTIIVGEGFGSPVNVAERETDSSPKTAGLSNEEVTVFGEVGNFEEVNETIELVVEVLVAEGAFGVFDGWLVAEGAEVGAGVDVGVGRVTDSVCSF